MRLHLLPPSSLSSEQKELYDDMMGVVNENFGSFVTAREDGALIGPFNAMVHFPEFGRAAWAMNKAMYEHTTLPKSVLQVAMLVKPCHHFLYSGGAFVRLYPVNPSPTRNHAAKMKRRPCVCFTFVLDIWGLTSAPYSRLRSPRM